MNNKRSIVGTGLWYCAIASMCVWIGGCDSKPEQLYKWSKKGVAIVISKEAAGEVTLPVRATVTIGEKTEQCTIGYAPIGDDNTAPLSFSVKESGDLIYVTEATSPRVVFLLIDRKTNTAWPASMTPKECKRLLKSIDPKLVMAEVAKPDQKRI